MAEFVVVYDSNGADSGIMPSSIITYGEPTQLSKNVFIRKAFSFAGWTAFRMSDNKTCYENNETKERKFFVEGNQPEGWKIHVYKDEVKVAKLSKIDKDVIMMKAVWEKDDILMAAEVDVNINKKRLEERLRSKEIVLYGGLKESLKFYKKYKGILNIKKILLDEEGSQIGELNNDEIIIETFKPNHLNKNVYVVTCRDVHIRMDNKYQNIKNKLAKAGYVFIKDYIRADIASMILDKKKLWLWLGYCQGDTLRKEIFSELPSIKKEYTLVSFRYKLDTLKKSYKYEDCIELLKICDVLLYVPLIIDQGKVEFSFDELLPQNSQKVALPRIPFRGYYPYREQDIETFHKFSIDGKLHWPFGYEEKIIDDLILQGKSADEIYNELMREDLIDEKIITRNLKLCFKFLEISESVTDIKMSDFLKENLTKRLLYRDGLHYQNFVYFEIARRIARLLNLNCDEEINHLEKNIDENGKQFIDFTEIPILPCVCKALKLDFITDETLWRVRTTESGAWRGTKAIVRKMTRKEWIYSYIEYTKACIAIRKYWNYN